MPIFEGVSIFIAIVGLLFAIYEGRLNRQYHRISLMPKLIIRKHLGGSQGKLGISVTNEGSGVGLIDDCIVTFNNENKTWNEVLEELDIDEIDKIGTNNIISGAIAAGKSEWLLYADVGHNDFKKKLREAIDSSQIQIKITYESVFHEKDEALLEAD